MKFLCTRLVLACLVLSARVSFADGPPPNIIVSESGNTAGGDFALGQNTTGASNTAFGVWSLENNTTGGMNVAYGNYSLSRNLTGEANTASGWSAMLYNTTGYFNTATGVEALRGNKTGWNNTAFGIQAVQYNIDGVGNVGVGGQALRTNAFGNYNTAIGTLALDRANGRRNTAIGVGAGGGLRNGDNNIYLGHAGVATENNTLRLGSTQTRAFIRGVAGRPLTGQLVVINSAGQLGVRANSSSAEEMLPQVLQVVEAQQQQIEMLQDRLEQQAQQIQAILQQKGK